MTVHTFIIDERVSNERLATRSAKGDDEATAELVRRLEGLVRLIAKTFWLAWGERDDLWQEGRYGILIAASSWDPSHEIPFDRYAAVCIRRSLGRAAKQQHRLKHQFVTDAARLAMTHDPAGIAPAAPHSDPAELVELREEIRAAGAALQEDLTPLERQCVQLSVLGYSPAEIQRILERPDTTSVENGLYRGHSKLSSHARARTDDAAAAVSACGR